MRSRLDELLEPVGLVLEVDVVDVRAGRKAAPVRDDEARSARRAGAAPPRSRSPLHDAAVHEEEPRGEPLLHRATNLTRNSGNRRDRCVTSEGVFSGMLALQMQAASPSSFDPAGAGGVLLGALVVCIGLGVLARLGCGLDRDRRPDRRGRGDPRGHRRRLPALRAVALMPSALFSTPRPGAESLAAGARQRARDPARSARLPARRLEPRRVGSRGGPLGRSAPDRPGAAPKPFRRR